MRPGKSLLHAVEVAFILKYLIIGLALGRLSDIYILWRQRLNYWAIKERWPCGKINANAAQHICL